MLTVTAGDVVIGDGNPKICVPIVADTVDGILRQANRIMRSPADIVEWRADCFHNVMKTGAVLSALKKLSANLRESRPILFTFRTDAEGGNCPISEEKYISLYKAVIKSGKVQLIDIEYALGPKVRSQLLSLAHENNVAVIFSYHNFTSTPPEREMVEKYISMKNDSADIAKIAVMPETNDDVYSLLSASAHMMKEENPVPVITISMSQMGVVSRVACGLTGSAVTFASVGKTSAPGQIDADELDRFMMTIRGGRNADFDKERKIENGNIVLTGFMGVGKSTVARHLSKKTGWKTAELDDMIVKNEKMPISKIFDEKGEEYFRDAETEQVRRVSEKKGMIISCGGGTVLRKENVDLLKQNGTVIFLCATADSIYKRLKNSVNKRPLLRDYMSRGYISWLMKKRYEIYESTADIIIHTDNRSSKDIAKEIAEMINA